MGAKATNLKGRKFGRLTVLEATEKRSPNKCVVHKCKCSCGNIKEVPSDDLLKGFVKSCGCLQHESNIKNGNQAGKIYVEKNIIEGTNIQALQTKIISTNTSGTKGVHWDKAREKWVARIIFQGKDYFLGRYTKKEDAIEARTIAEKEMHGKFLEEYRKKGLKMKKSRAVKKETFKVLNDRFLDKRRILRIDEEYLNSEIQTHLMSDEKLYNQIKNIKKPDEIVKGGLVLIANILLNTKYIEGDRHATKKQIEDWLRDEGRGDLSILESIEYVEQERIMLKNTEN